MEGSVRLSGGDIEQEGIPEVCISGVWGSICDSGWTSFDGQVICKELGYDDIGISNLKIKHYYTRNESDYLLPSVVIDFSKLAPIVYSNSYFGDGDGPIVWSSISCSGQESSISLCPKSQYLYFSSSRNDVAGVLCQDGM